MDNYIKTQEANFKKLRRLLKSNEETIEGLDGIYYTKEEIRCQLERTLSRIDGIKRLTNYEKNGIWSKRQKYVIEALATAEYQYYLEVENAMDTYISNQILDQVADGQVSITETKFLLKNNNEKIENRSSIKFKENWIKNRVFEVASVIHFDTAFDFKEETFSSVNCLDSIMSGKASRQELIDSGYWQSTNDLFATIKKTYNGLIELTKQ